MKKIRKYLSTIRRKYFYREGIEKVTILGKELVLIKGTMKDVDYDDAWFLYLANHSTILFDVGANIGYTALIANLTGKPTHILLVDPNGDALSWAAKNLIKNGLGDNCIFNSSLITDNIGDTVQFFTTGAGAAGSIFKDQAESAKMFDEFRWTKSTTIDALVSNYGLVPDLVKIDIEGAEHSALVGSVTLAGLKKTRFMIEMHSNTELSMEKNAGSVLEWCKLNEYKAWYLKSGEHLIAASQIADRGRCHLVLQPKDWEYPVYLKGIAQGAELPLTLS